MNVTRPVFLVDIIGDVASRCANAKVYDDNGIDTGKTLLETLKIANANIQEINFKYGHLREITNLLDEYSKTIDSAFKKYPLIILIMDFPEDRGQLRSRYADVTLEMAIVMGSETSWTAEKRYEINFRPILYPLYYEFLNQLSLEKRIDTSHDGLIGKNNISHRKIDRPYWDSLGKDANIFNDAVDIIQISNLKIKLNFNIC